MTCSIELLEIEQFDYLTVKKKKKKKKKKKWCLNEKILETI